MSSLRCAASLSAILSIATLTACGGGTSPAQPAPVPTPTPTPVPTPTPMALSVIPPCPLAASDPGPSASCTKPDTQLQDAVYAAIDRTLTQRPDLFDFNDVNGGPRILNVPAYMVAVVSALGQAGICGKVDAEGEIGVKTSNSYNEQWIIASRVGWGVPTENWVERKYVGACSPSTF
ncbi:MAG TPA: hypothetical protein VMT70_07215 [Vicinamibacteria bacterium]|nr:hypothetical protein [Vicinamibacteria bacterium]